MLRVQMSQAKPGMVLAQPVFHPRSEGQMVLLRAKATLEQGAIDRLVEMKIPEVWIHYPGMEMVGEFISPKIMASRALIAGDVSKAFIGASQGAHAKLDFQQYKSSMSSLLKNLINDPKSSIFVGELVDSGFPAVRHGANVGFLSLLLGMRLGFYMMRERKYVNAKFASDVTNLGVAGMLHDIGMMRLDEEVIKRWNKNHDPSDPQWQEHTTIGHQAVRGSLRAPAASAVLHHHQHFDGSGFPMKEREGEEPSGLFGSEIHVYPRIILAADLFDRLSHRASSVGEDPGDGIAMPAVCTLKKMMGKPYGDWIDPVIFKALLAVCPAYPPGTLVRLSNGVKGVVTDWNQADPCRPQVHEMLHFEYEELGRVFNLRNERTITIVECDGIDVSEHNFYPVTKGQFDLRVFERNLSNGLYQYMPEEAA
ncbi:MAG: HD domain-containing protein [Phycisphaerales bacterium]|nr:HD domain-containing protein [Phycisphaerales bacterium]